MKSYWYVSLTHKYPQSNRSTVSMRVVMSVQIKKNDSIVEMTREAHRKKLILVSLFIVVVVVGKISIYKRM